MRFLICVPSAVVLLIAVSGLSGYAYAIPPNAHVVGDGWKCNTGFKRQGQQCNKIFVPPNAVLRSQGWICKAGFKQVGKQCNRTSGSPSLRRNKPVPIHHGHGAKKHSHILPKAGKNHAHGKANIQRKKTTTSYKQAIVNYRQVMSGQKKLAQFTKEEQRKIAIVHDYMKNRSAVSGSNSTNCSVLANTRRGFQSPARHVEF